MNNRDTRLLLAVAEHMHYFVVHVFSVFIRFGLPTGDDVNSFDVFTLEHEV